MKLPACSDSVVFPYFSAAVSDDMVVFNFTDGDQCMHDPLKRPRNTVLTMYCSPTAHADSLPTFSHETVQDCTYMFYWPRADLCHRSFVSDKTLCLLYSYKFPFLTSALVLL